MWITSEVTNVVSISDKDTFRKEVMAPHFKQELLLFVKKTDSKALRPYKNQYTHGSILNSLSAKRVNSLIVAKNCGQVRSFGIWIHRKLTSHHYIFKYKLLVSL